MSGIGKIAISLIIAAALFIGCAATKGAKKESEVKSINAPIERQITRVSASEKQDSIDIRVTGNQLLTFTSIKQPSPAGVILYFPETTSSVEIIQTGMVQGSDILETIKMGELAGRAQ